MSIPRVPRSLTNCGMSCSNQYYELRFPRMTKAYRRRDRTWRECISLEEFQRIARETVGRERPNKEADDWCKNLFGKVASPGVKHPLRRKQREEAIIADLERVEGNQRDGGHESKDYNSRKRKRTVDSIHRPKDERPHHCESTYSENVGRTIGGSPLRAVLFPQLGPPPPILPVTPTRPRLSRRLAPLGSMTNLTSVDPTTPPKSPLDDRGRDRFKSGEFKFGEDGKSKDSKAHSSGNPDPFVDYDRKSGDRVGPNTSRIFAIPPSAPPLSPSTTAQQRSRMDPKGDTDPHTVPRNPPTKVDIDVQVANEKSTPLVSRPQSPSDLPQINLSSSIAGRSLPTPVSNGPMKGVPPPASSPTVPGVKRMSPGVKRKREAWEDVHSPSKRAATVGSLAPVQKVPGPSCDLKPSETWSPDETTFMEEPRPARDNLRSKTRGGNMSVDAIKARLIRATSTLQVLPSQKPDTTVRNPTAVIEACNIKSTRVDGRVDPVMYEKQPEGGAEPDRPKVGPPVSRLGIPAPFPPGTSRPGSSLERPNNSDKIAAYLGADGYYTSRPPPSATPPRLPKDPDLVDEGEKLLASGLSEGQKLNQNDVPAGQPDQPELEDNKKTLGRFPSFVLVPQQLLFTDTAVGKLLSTSVIWFARDVHVPEPSHRPSSLQLVPRLNEVSQLESLLVACGWHRKRSFTSKRGIERGVVFVDYEEQSDVPAVVKTHWVAQQCENAYRLATQYHSPAERGMKPIWVVDARMMKWEGLRAMKPGDVLDTLEEFVLWKKE